VKEHNREKRARIETKEYLDRILDYNPHTGQLTWRVLWPNRRAGTINTDGYIKVVIERLDFKAHRLCWIMYYGSAPQRGAHIDHMNRNKKDNRISNLRVCGAKENQQNANTPKNNTSGYKGVAKVRKSPKFRAYICVNRKQIHLGMFDTPEEAHSAYCQAATSYFGEYACLDH
jgi:hypothetical protein